MAELTLILRLAPLRFSSGFSQTALSYFRALDPTWRPPPRFPTPEAPVSPEQSSTHFRPESRVVKKEIRFFLPGENVCCGIFFSLTSSLGEVTSRSP